MKNEESKNCAPAPTANLVDIAMGYARSRALCTAARLKLADAIHNGTGAVDELAKACAAEKTSLHRLLRALASFGIVVEKSPGVFALTEMGEPLRKDSPKSVWAAIIFWADLLADNWSQLTECVRTGKTARQVMEQKGIASLWSRDPDAPAIFRAVMGTALQENYIPIVDGCGLESAKVVADLGGGGGALIVAALKRHPHLRGILVDRKESADVAQGRLKSEGLESRCQWIAADLSQSVPGGADVFILKHVLHGCDDENARRMLANCRKVMTADNRLLIVEFVLPRVVDRVDPKLEYRLMSDLNMMAVTGGKERTEVEWRRLLEESGFALQRVTPLASDPASIVQARINPHFEEEEEEEAQSPHSPEPD